MTKPSSNTDEGRQKPNFTPCYPPGANVILCADDFAMTDGVSRGITELALARRLSATSAIVTLPAWKAQAKALFNLRPFIATGLHVNLTLGAPLGRAPGLAPDGEFAGHMALLRKSLTGGIGTDEIAAEIEQQLNAFESATGTPPDFVDGHQHVHTLPKVRRALIDVLAARYPNVKPLVRDPGDDVRNILRRRAAASKALVLHALASGFGSAVRAAGFPTNDGFSGVSPFNMDIPFERELARFFVARGRRHLVMCHPGYPDAALADLDPVVERRHQELDTLFAAPRLDEALWHVHGRADRPPVDWERALPL